MGHNFGARHDLGIMTAILDVSAYYFTQTTVNQMCMYVFNATSETLGNAECLTPILPSLPPLPSFPLSPSPSPSTSPTMTFIHLINVNQQQVTVEKLYRAKNKPHASCRCSSALMSRIPLHRSFSARVYKSLQRDKSINQDHQAPSAIAVYEKNFQEATFNPCLLFE